jgi:zinc transport system substrate-binding protein
MRDLYIVLVLFLVPTHLLGCADSPPSSDRIKVTVSIFPLADIVKNVGGDRVEVELLIPPGASPHVFEPPPEAFREFAKTRLFVVVGAGLEFWAERLISATADKPPVVIRAAEGVDLIQLDDHGREHRPDHYHQHQPDANPHVWLDPLVAKSLAQRVAQALVQLDPEHADQYQARLAAYGERLDTLDQTIREAVEKFQITKYVAFHPAWSYFARRYGLVEMGVIQESPGREPTPKHLHRIIQAIEDYQIRAVFTEPQLNPRAAAVIASEAAVEVLILDPLGGSDLTGRDSYVGLMEYNLRIMQEAMQ